MVCYTHTTKVTYSATITYILHLSGTFFSFAMPMLIVLVAQYPYYILVDYKEVNTHMHLDVLN